MGIISTYTACKLVTFRFRFYAREDRILRIGAKMPSENGIDRDKLIAESARHLAGTDENEKLLAFLADEHKRFNAEIVPLIPADELDDFQEYDEAKNEFLESLWDVIQQHFDDLG